MKQQVEQLVGYLSIYKFRTVKNPVPGAFELIGQSYLSNVLRGAQPAAGAAVIGPGGQPVAVPQNQPAGNRDGWRPLGEVAAGIFGGGGGGAAVGNRGAGPMGNPPAGDPKMGDAKKGSPALAPLARTEFVLLFTWREPIAVNPNDKTAGMMKP